MFNLITCTTAGVSLSVLVESEAMQLAYQKTKRALTRTNSCTCLSKQYSTMFSIQYSTCIVSMDSYFIEI